MKREGKTRWPSFLYSRHGVEEEGEAPWDDMVPESLGTPGTRYMLSSLQLASFRAMTALRGCRYDGEQWPGSGRPGRGQSQPRLPILRSDVGPSIWRGASFLKKKTGPEQDRRRLGVGELHSSYFSHSSNLTDLQAHLHTFPFMSLATPGRRLK